MATSVHRLLRAAVPVVTVPVLLVSLSACGGDDAPASSPSPAASSAPESSATPTRAASQQSAGTSVDTADFTALIRRSLDAATTAQIGLELVTTGGTLTGSGQVDYTGSDPALSMRLTTPQFGDADLRVVDQTLYVSLSALDKSGTFYKSDLGDPEAAAALGGLSGFDPAASLAALSRSVTDVELVGTEELDGDQVDHYTFTADGSALPGAASGGSADPVSADVWFDGQDRLRKTTTRLNPSTSVTITLSDWDSAVDISAPPAGKVKTMPSTGPGN